MFGRDKQPKFRIEPLGDSSGQCDCCGNESRCVWGLVYNRNDAEAAYWMHWTPSHLADAGANLDVVLGRWGESATADDRVAISLLHRVQPDGSSALMVIDAAARPIAKKGLAGKPLTREDVIGSPLAAQLFSLTDAIYEQDTRFF